MKNIKIKPGEIISTSEPIFVGPFPIREEIETLPSDSPSPKGWTVQKVVGINGNKYLKLLTAYLKKNGKTSEDELSQAEIDELYSKCEI